MAYITLNKNNFFTNLDIIAKRTSSKDKIAIVLKDNAYGHGLEEMASMSYEYGIKRAVVQTSMEAKQIEKYFDYILVLAQVPTEASKKIRYTINDIKSIDKFAKDSLVELKVDTGMHRNGISMDELENGFKKIKEAGLILEAVFTHHRSSDELTSEWFWQNENFKKVKEESINLAKEYGFDKPRFHSANSASLFRTKECLEDMVRVGISAYGYLEANFIDIGLKPVLSLYANKISSRTLSKGKCVGYGAAYKIKEKTIVSNYDFGYGSGFLRACSNNYKTPNGSELVGRISMDNSSFISDEDQLLVFNDVQVVAKSANSISYEVLTSLKEDIKREIC